MHANTRRSVRPWRWVSRLFARVIALAVAAGQADGQTATSSVSGVVRDTARAAVAGASVDIRDAATGYVSQTVTNGAGRYTLLGITPGGPFTVRVRRVGYRAEEHAGLQITLGARPSIDFTLVPIATRLADVTVLADTAAGAETGRDARIGGSTRIGRERIDGLPIVDRNFTGLASLSPLAGNQLTLAGQRYTGTDFRIDGVGARNMLRGGEANGGPAGISIEAIREFEVNTSVFDVEQGRQGGGQVAAITRTGTNTAEARVFTAFRNEQLSASTDFQGRSRAVRSAQVMQSALAFGGPLRRDRAHFFVAYERQDASEPLVTGDVSTPAAQVATGVAQDSLKRILDILQRQYGTTSASAQLGRLARRPVSQNLFARADWQITAGQRATLRVTASDWTSPLSGGVDQAIALREARSEFRSRETQALAALTSRFAASRFAGGAVNELQLALSHSRRALVPESPGVPRGFVQVRSALPDGTTGNSTIQFGGNRLAPDDSREWQVQLIDRLAMQRGRILYTVGTDNSLVRTRTLIAEAQSGLFVFPSIAALETRQANRFTRTVPLSGASPATRQSILELGAYAQAEWEIGERMTWTNGVRWDGTAFLKMSPRNRMVDQAFGVNSARAPADWLQLQPRSQLLWRVDAAGRDVLRIGVGLFSSQLPYYAGHNGLLYSGTQLTDIDLRGAGVPAPDFAGYRAGTAAVPGVTASAPLPPAFVNVTGTVRAPRTLKGTLAWSHRTGEALTTTLGASVTSMRSGYHYVDLNLPAAPAFRLGAEQGRAVWVPSASIPAATGVTDVRNASRVQEYARVLSLESGARSRQVAITAETDFRVRAWLRGTAAYAWSKATDNSTYGCCLARTATTFTPVADDPRDLAQAWAPSDFDARHRVVTTAAVRAPFGIEISARYTGTSGRPFSLVVDGDINGDEANGNDRAFLFDPSDPNTPADVAASMQRVLANPRNLAARYIRAHLGEIAGRNSVYTPWTNRIDARFSRRFSIGRAVRSAEVLLDVFNLGNLLNSQWGAQYPLPVGISSQNPVVNRIPLLRVVGFDPATQRFRYTVNESAGVLPKGGDPYQLQLGIRIAR